MSLSADETHFVTIGKGIHVFRPQSTTIVEPTHPTLVLIFGWMGARLPHLHKYTSVYREMYPNTTILLVQSEPSFFWSTECLQRKALAPVVGVLGAVGCIPPSPQNERKAPNPPIDRPRILVHVFSNGGCFQMVTLGKLLDSHQAKSITSTGSTSVVIFDSCPGSGSFKGSQQAFASVVRNPMARLLVKVVVTVLFCIQFVMKQVLRRQAYFQAMKTRLNNPDVLPWTSKATPRLYLYSEGDDLVEVNAVEDHMRSGRENGYAISAEKFGKESKHVSHVRTDPQRYWAAIRRLWKEALGLGEDSYD
ncbi:hypothetical protein NP233_g3397 [Leucocoprinus birnbaumii]|uniref:DUF829-domain-containing protein n=1 Tax=Leucocoprinus birnbaumii TaxID=56174 RepID=A0AAD5VY12_9AGAR|nr:hypothetical protein NP233_g3397 [Leucocoprinus birnbaumii]